MTPAVLDQVERALGHAVQLALIASDWNLEEVEIAGKMVEIYDVCDEFREALSALRAARKEG